MILSIELSIFSLCAVAIILLLVRYYLRVRRDKRSADLLRSQKQQEAAVTALAASSHTAENAVDPVTSIMAPSSPDVSWQGRQLFASPPAVNQQDDANDVPKIEPHEVPTVDISDYAFGPITPILAALLPESARRVEETKGQLQTAGYYQPHAIHNLAAIRYVFMMSMLVFCGLLLIVVPIEFEAWVMGSLVVLPLMGWAVPRVYIQVKATQRTTAIEQAMPDMFDLLNMCVSQGLTVPESLARVGSDLRPVYPELAQELSIVSQQAEVGTLQIALENFSKRVDVSDVHMFTSLINQTSRLGTSVSAALTEYSDSMRENFIQRANEKANQASFKLLFPTVICLMPAVYIFLLGPAIKELSQFFNEGGRNVLDQGVQALERFTQ